MAEPGMECLTNADFPEGYALMTNFSLAEHQPVRCKRYKTASRMLEEDRTGTERLWSILEAVRQTGGNMPTIFSLVTELDTGEIRFTLDGDFSRRYLFSFSDRCIRSEKGFASEHLTVLSGEGISAARLREWE